MLRYLRICSDPDKEDHIAKQFRPTFGSRLANRLLTRLLRAGRGPSFMRLLTVVGRRSGREYTTPVVPVLTDRGRWLVSPYGEVSWVRNARAAGTVTLSRGQVAETLVATEVDPGRAAPVLRTYLAMKPAGRFVRAYFDVSPDSSDDELDREAPRHPVFELSDQQPG